MVRRVRRKVKVKKVKMKRTATKRQREPAASANQKAYWAAYKDLQKRVDKAWLKLKSDVKKKAAPQVLIRDKNHLLLLLGECNYMTRECMRIASGRK